MNPTLRHAAAHVFVDSLEDPQLDEPDRHHLLRVLRLRAGATVSASDGRGSWRTCELADDGSLSIVGPVVTTTARSRVRTIATAIPKGDRPELIVQKLTELGVDRIVFVAAERSVVRWDERRVDQQLDRLRRIARAAAMQSRRVWLPCVEGVVTLRSLADAAPDGLVIAEPGGRPLRAADATVVVGPEGGFAPGELSGELPRVGLADTVLRVETAAIAAAALMAQRS